MGTECDKCKSTTLLACGGKVCDMFWATYIANGNQYEGYVPNDIGIGGGDYIEFSYCLDCGQIQNWCSAHKGESVSGEVKWQITYLIPTSDENQVAVISNGPEGGFDYFDEEAFERHLEVTHPELEEKDWLSVEILNYEMVG